MPRLRRYWRLLRVAGVVLSGLIVAGALGIAERCAIPVSALRKQRLTQWFLTRLAAALPFRLRVTGELPTQPMLWVANHVSWCDIPLLGMLAPLSFLAKAEVRAWPALGWLAQAAGTLFIRRGGGDAALVNRQLATQLVQGRHLLIFPEGTSTDGTDVRTFHPRLFACALEAGCAVQPVAIRYWRNGKPDTVAPFVGDDELPAHLRRLLTSDICDVEIQLLPPIDVMALDRKAVAMNAQQAIANALLVEPRAQISKAA
ncbi:MULTISPECIES: lysophospholipid acyltransferase family protein [Stutzerimonas stutzeri group]|jgi:1-acyl-sn-glycerol-3-phosphate acyltransferase|uniref:lysophospholipid acyltransferase family protein n=1 Tax=Stutzerimonas stutzeri group TaxID=136846 RepID=UPI00065011A6|nr:MULTISPECIES: lysophospholipid acyltransferase family protein [Stutzerimonas stutzeri group]AKN26054.1 acyltransferase [Stutzerimonas stutzeri]MBK3757693.1 1-acyl-sn-glycerol-3-phosphate acyltransferase [Stutzerimonas frequens]MBK3872822.1 1-acyl-sn-glycerol-3-phosphate acyltransferase [Stutzerimonas frequens]MBK3911093.1 1-acyl-sn-glycerol-3-phosphate acyltransferase [Stutzerimonas frequens]MBK3930375.1 1-acyl-sn-glycerol-3-phosphate acyltransferase [Stutzerimonas frequens]